MQVFSKAYAALKASFPAPSRKTALLRCHAFTHSNLGVISQLLASSGDTERSNVATYY
jgi:hypothetical protein